MVCKDSFHLKFLVGFIFIVLISYLFHNHPSECVIGFLIYVFSLLVLYVVKNSFKNNSVHNIYTVLLYPISCSYMPIGLLLIAAAFSCIVFIAPFVLSVYIVKYLSISIKTETLLFLCISLGSIFSVSVNKQIIKVLFGFVKLVFNSNYNPRRYKYFNKLVCKLYKSNVLTLFVYTLYFIFLLIVSYCKIQGTGPFLSETYDSAILQSFLVFIAYSNICTKSSGVNLCLKQFNDIYNIL